MAILNRAEYDAELLSLIPDNSAGQISPADIRAVHTNNVDSLQSYGGVMTDGVVSGVSITTTPLKWLNFSTNNTGPNALLESDYVNGQIKVFQPALYFCTLRFFGQWGVGSELIFEVRVNGVVNSLTPINFAQKGQGVNAALVVSVTDLAFIVDSAMVAAGGDSAKVSLYLSTSSGSFSLDQLGVTMGLEYNPLSIRTVG